MKTNKNLTIILLIIFISLCNKSINAQSCKKTFYNAKVQYDSGQFEKTQNLLGPCIKAFNENKSHYRNERELVKKVYELYIASCNKARNTECAKQKRKELDAFFR